MSAGPPTAEALADERARLRRLRAIVDLTTSVLRQGGLDRGEAEALVAAARRRILDLFPDKETVYELVLAPRFARLVAEFTCPDARRRPARVLHFQS
ncbi:MAG TPA: hypothetical protein VMT87_04315 [Vicinamibacteria bacterium]|nr:hypothetical protein [Vicinamibacteria bacterium]